MGSCKLRAVSLESIKKVNLTVVVYVALVCNHPQLSLVVVLLSLILLDCLKIWCWGDSLQCLLLAFPDPPGTAHSDTHWALILTKSCSLPFGVLPFGDTLLLEPFDSSSVFG
jgi:hypothetical protein